MFHGVRLAGRFLSVIFLLGFCQGVLAIPLAGTYTIGGASPDFATITDAVGTLNSEGISAPVTFAIRAGTYDERTTIQDFPRTGNADDRVTFQRAPFTIVVNWEFTGANSAGTNYVVKLDGASYITIRGITFTSAGSSPFGKIVSFEGGASNINIENSTFTGFIGVNDDDATLILQSEVGDHSDNHFTGNSFTYGYKAIDMDYLFGGFDSNGLLIDDNTFTAQTRGAVETGSIGAVVSGNIVNDNTVSDTLYIGLNIRDSSAVVEANAIDIRKGWVGIWYFSSLGAASIGTISNNMVSMHSVSSERGVYVAASGVNVHHNTISVRAEAGTSALDVAAQPV